MKLSDLFETKSNFYVKLWGKVNDVQIDGVSDLEDLHEKIGTGASNPIKKKIEAAFAELVNAKGDHYAAEIQEVIWEHNDEFFGVDLYVSTPDLDGEAPRTVRGEVHQS